MFLSKGDKTVDTHDRAFIQDVIQFIYMNHIVTVCTLQKSLTIPQAQEIAHLTLGPNQSYDSAEMLGIDTVRVLRIVAAKIYAENIAVLEDLVGPH
jgi:hypothetical protein